MNFKKLREKVLYTNKLLPKLDLVLFTWGNVSEVDRDNNVFAIKPSGVSYDEMKAEDIVIVSLETGEVIEGELKPSTDTETHRILYNEFEDIGGIVHTHSTWATSWSQSKRNLPAYGTTHADTFYGNVPCTRNLTKEEMADNYELSTGEVIVETFENLNIDPQDIPSVLVSGHGPFSWGEDSEEAVYNAKVLEQCAKTAFITESINNDIQEVDEALLDKHYLRKHGEESYYGQDR